MFVVALLWPGCRSQQVSYFWRMNNSLDHCSRGCLKRFLLFYATTCFQHPFESLSGCFCGIICVWCVFLLAAANGVRNRFGDNEHNHIQRRQREQIKIKLAMPFVCARVREREMASGGEEGALLCAAKRMVFIKFSKASALCILRHSEEANTKPTENGKASA